MRITVFGLGAGGGDDITIGTVRRLKELKAAGAPLLLRTSRHPAVEALKSTGVVFDRSFDSSYDRFDTFDGVYDAIVDGVLDAAGESGQAAYAVPGHPLLGEATVQRLLAKHNTVQIDIQASVSFIDSCLVAAKSPVDGIVVVDALSLPEQTDLYSRAARPFLPSVTQLIYQVYDRTVASRVKIALLDFYPFDHLVTIVASAGVFGAERVRTTPLHVLDRHGSAFDHLTSVLVPPRTPIHAPNDFEMLLDTMGRLRHPQSGCPWDREQTPQKLKRYAVEEVYEVLDAIDDGDPAKYAEELGDLLLQVVFHAQLAKESGDFSIEDVLTSINDKLVRRHPHVFGEVSVKDADEVLTNWNIIKQAEKGNENRKSRLDGVPRELPALAQALEFSKRAARTGFEWDSIDGVFAKLDEEVMELREALAEGDAAKIAGELGDLLFTAVNLARFSNVDAEDALRTMVKRFSRRFRSMETRATVPLEQLDQPALEALWREAKREESR